MIMFQLIHVLLLAVLTRANAHGDHGHNNQQIPLAADADWQTRHMLGKQDPVLATT